MSVACIVFLLDGTDLEGRVVAVISFLCSGPPVLILCRHDLKLPLNTEHMLAYHLTTDVSVGPKEDLIRWGRFSINPTLALEKFKVPTHWKTAYLLPFLLRWPHSLCICVSDSWTYGSGLAFAEEQEDQDYSCLVDMAIWPDHSWLQFNSSELTPSFSLLLRFLHWRELMVPSLGICVTSSITNYILKGVTIYDI